VEKIGNETLPTARLNCEEQCNFNGVTKDRLRMKFREDPTAGNKMFMQCGGLVSVLKVIS